MSTSPANSSTVPLSQILGALSHALDMTEGQPPGHCLRAARIGARIGEAIGLGAGELRDLRYAILLKDLGCSSNAARICQLYLTDDLRFKRDFKRIDDGLPAVLGFVVQQTGTRGSLAERFRTLVDIFRNGGEIAQELIETRCQRGADIARRLRFSEEVALAIGSLDEHWDGGGRPVGLSGEQIPLFSRIALLAQVVDVFAGAAGREGALAEARRRAGRWFDPALVAALERAAARGDLWPRSAGDADPLAVFECGTEAPVEDDYLDDIAEAFGDIVDSKSPYTSGHCRRVALYTDLIGETMGFTPAKRGWMKRAGLLHDIGKLGVSNSILDKAGPLDGAEWIAMRAHSVHSRTILTRIGAFGELAEIGGSHHERLDGRGYPAGIGGDEIGLDTRIVTVADIFDALTAERPYRAAMPVSQALDILRRDCGTAVDPVCVEALTEALARADPRVALVGISRRPSPVRIATAA